MPVFSRSFIVWSVVLLWDLICNRAFPWLRSKDSVLKHVQWMNNEQKKNDLVFAPTYRSTWHVANGLLTCVVHDSFALMHLWHLSIILTYLVEIKSSTKWTHPWSLSGQLKVTVGPDTLHFSVLFNFIFFVILPCFLFFWRQFYWKHKLDDQTESFSFKSTVRSPNWQESSFLCFAHSLKFYNSTSWQLQ